MHILNRVASAPKNIESECPSILVNHYLWRRIFRVIQLEEDFLFANDFPRMMHKSVCFRYFGWKIFIRSKNTFSFPSFIEINGCVAKLQITNWTKKNIEFFFIRAITLGLLSIRGIVGTSHRAFHSTMT